MATKPLTKLKKRIGELLVEAEVITRGQLEEALAAQGKEGGKIVEVLIGLGYLDTAKVAQFLSSQPGVPSIDLSNYRVAKEVVRVIPREFAIKNELFPIDQLGKLLTIGMAFPLDTKTIESIQEMTGLRVKALLCNPVDIRNAIEHYYASEPTPNDSADKQAQQINAGARVESMAALIRQIDGLPTLPQTVQQVQEAVANPESSAKEVARIVSQDPAISGKLLKLANSAAYGFSHKVDNVELATSLLGLRETIMAVTSSAVIATTESAKHFDHAAFWQRSMICATAARRIGVACGLKKNSGLFTAGLLCEIGRFALCESAAARYAKIPSGLSDAELHDAEEKLFGIGHAEAGYLLAEHWGLPEELTEPIRYHLSPDSAQTCPEFTAVVALAARCADGLARGEEAGPELLAGMESSMQRLGVGVDDLLPIFSDLGTA